MVIWFIGKMKCYIRGLLQKLEKLGHCLKNLIFAPQTNAFMKYIYLLSVLCVFLGTTTTSCNQKSSPNRMSNCAVKISQGVYGRVFWVTGNLMPKVGEKPKKRKQNKKPVVRQLWFYPLMLKSKLKTEGRLYKLPDSKPVAVTTSDEDGCYQIKLPPGRYSVFTVEETNGQKKLFANMFDGQGNVNPIEVKTRDLTELNIKINYKAVF